MSIIIRLQRLAWSASAADIREFFRGLTIPEGGVHIVGGRDGDAFIAFASDEDARVAMRLDNKKLKEQRVRLYLSSRQEMQKVIDKARTEYAGMTGSAGGGGGGSGAPQPIGAPASLLDDDQNGSSTNGVARRANNNNNNNKRGRGSRSRSRSGSRDRSGGTLDYDIMGQQQQRYPGGRDNSRSPDIKRMAISQQPYGKSLESIQSQPATQLLNQLNSAIFSSSSSSNQIPTSVGGYGSAATAAAAGTNQQQQQQYTPPHVHHQLTPSLSSQQSSLDPRLQSAHHQQHLAQQQHQQQQPQQSTTGLFNSSLFGGSQQIHQQSSSTFHAPQAPAGYPMASTTTNMPLMAAAAADQQAPPPFGGGGNFSSSSALFPQQQVPQSGHPAYQNLSATSQQQHQPTGAPFHHHHVPPSNQSTGPLLADGLPIFSDFDARNAGPFGPQGPQPFGQKTSLYHHVPPTSSYQNAAVVPPGTGPIGGFDFNRQNAGPLLPNVPGLPPVAGTDYSAGGGGSRSRNRMTLLPEPGDPQMGMTLNRLPLPAGPMDQPQTKGFMDLNVMDGFPPPQLDPSSSALIGQSTTTLTGPGGPPPFGGVAPLPPPPAFGGAAAPPQPFLPAVGQKIQMHIQQQQQLQAAQQQQQAPPGGGLPPLAPLPANPHQLFREGVFMDTATFPIGQPTMGGGGVNMFGQQSTMLAPPIEPNCCICLDNVPPDLLRYGEIRIFFNPMKLEGSESIKIIHESNRVYCRFLNPMDTDQALRFDGRQGMRIRPCQDFEFDSAQDSFRTTAKNTNQPSTRGSYGSGGGGGQSGLSSSRGSYDSSNEWDAPDGKYFVALTNIAYRIPDGEIWDLVSRLRPRSLRRRMIYKNNQLMTSDEAYVEFLNQKDAEEALQQTRGRILAGRRISSFQTTMKRIEREETRLFEPRQSPDYQNLSGGSTPLDHDGRRPLASSASTSRDQYDSRDSRDSSKFGGGRSSRDYERDRDSSSASRNRRRSRDRSRERDGGGQSGGKRSSRDRSKSRERYGSRSRDASKDKEGNTSRGGNDDKQKDGKEKSKQKDKDFRISSSDTSGKISSSENSSNAPTPILKRTPKSDYNSFGFETNFSQSGSSADPFGSGQQQPSSLLTNQNHPTNQNNQPPTTNQNQPPPQQQAAPPIAMGGSAEKFTCVYMSGLSPNTTVRDVQTFFQKLRVAHGGVRLMREPKGGAYVEFCSSRDCEAALAKNKEYIGVQVVNIRPCSKTEMMEALQKQHGVAPPPQQQNNSQSGSSSMLIGPSTTTLTPAKDQQLIEPAETKENLAGGPCPISNIPSNAPTQAAPPSRLPTLFDDEIVPPSFLNRQQQSHHVAPQMQQRPWGPRGAPQLLNQHRPPFFGGPGPQQLPQPPQQQHMPPPGMPVPPTTRPVAAVAASVRGHVGLLGNEPGLAAGPDVSPAPAPIGPLNAVKQQQINGGQQQAQVTVGQQQSSGGAGGPNGSVAANTGNKLPTNQQGGPAETSSTVQAPTATRSSASAMPVIDSGVVANLGPNGSVCFLHGLPPHITLEDICALFPTEQMIEDSVRMHYSHQTGEPTGDCLLAFATPTGAETACQRTNGRNVQGRTVQMWVVPTN